MARSACHPELLEGKPLKGLWFDRTQEYAARIRGEDVDRLKYATEEILELSPLPCWKDLTPEQYRKVWHVPSTSCCSTLARHLFSCLRG